MSTRRVIEIYYDTTKDQLCDSTGAPLGEAQKPYIIFREKPLVQLHLMKRGADSAFEPVTSIENNQTYSVVIDSDYNVNSSPLCYTPAVGINVSGDWASVDPTQGKFSIRLDASTESFRTRIGTASSIKSTKMEFAVFSNSELLFVCRFDFGCRNIMHGGTVVAPLEMGMGLLEEYQHPSGGYGVRLKNHLGEILVDYPPLGTTL